MASRFRSKRQGWQPEVEAVPDATMAQRFSDPTGRLGTIKAEQTADLIAAAADIALILDQNGTILDLALAEPDLINGGCESWVGQPWIQTVTRESRNKVEEILAEANDKGSSRRREINHPSAHGDDLPVRYQAVRVGEDDRIVAFGSDLRGVSKLQQRLVNTQMAMEREYSRLRQTESCYRLLYQLASEAVLIVDASTLAVADANPAASNLLGIPLPKLIGRRAGHLFDPDDRDAVKGLLTTALAVGKASRIEASLLEGGAPVELSVSLFRQADSAFLLLRVTPRAEEPAVEVTRGNSAFLDVIERLPEGFVVINGEREILSANVAFLDLVQVASAAQLKGRTLDGWFERASVDLNLLLASLREHGSVRRFPTILRGELGSLEQVEITGVSVPSDKTPLFGFIVRRASRTETTEERINGFPVNSPEQVAELIGHMPLKEVVRETTDVIERLCIEAALRMTGDNRASAAQILGLSRQSLYAKMRRFRLGDLVPEVEGPAVSEH